MALFIGIAGLPNVGKSTLFNALTMGHVPASNYPFCTTKPNVGVVEVPDEDLEKLSQLVGGLELTYATIKFVDLAGLIKGSSKGEGLGNQFLSEIRTADAILHLVRGFRDPDIAHPYPEIDPSRDIEVVELELILSDLEIINRRIDKVKRIARGGDAKAQEELRLLERIRATLDEGKKPALEEFSAEERAVIKSYQLLVMKPVLYVINISEKDISKKDFPYLPICAKLERELSELPPQEREEFQRELGLEESGLPRIIKASLSLLGLITFYTVEAKKVRAWPIQRATKAWDAAGLIHSDIQRGFIRAEVTRFEDVTRYGSLHSAKETGLTRIEGKDYQIQDKDVIYFRFSV